jgi:LysM repeat protein
MVRFVSAFCALAFAIAAAACAQDASPTAAGSPGGSDDVRVLRQLIEQQSRQIETLTQQVSKLNQLIEARQGGGATAGATPASTQNMPPVQESNAPAPGTTATGAPGTEPPKATAAAPDGSGLTHVVARGETLISIAKHYKVSVADLLKVNKIEDERKLQIGQTLTIPSTAKTSETPHP